MNRLQKSWLQWPLACRLPLAGLHAIGLRLHQGWLRRYPIRRPGSIAPFLPCLVIGGLRLSGSGKSTVTAEIADKALSRGMRVAILCYRRPQDLGRLGPTNRPSFTDPLEVTDSTPWEMASDEAVWLKKRLPGVQVFVTRNRQKSLEWLTRQNPSLGLDWVLCDDGIWDPRIASTNRLVLGQPDEALTWRDLFPAGMHRGWTGLTRSDDFWSCDESELRLAGKSMSPSPANWIGTFRRVTRWTIPDETIRRPPPVEWERNPESAALLVCGHGNVKAMRSELARQGFELDHVLEARPHGDLPMREMVLWAQGHPNGTLFMSPRDAVKIPGLPNRDFDWGGPFRFYWHLAPDSPVTVRVCSHQAVFSESMNRWLESQAFPQMRPAPSGYPASDGVRSA